MRPFYTATPQDPQRVALRRRFRAQGRRLLDIADEALDGSTLDGASVGDFLLDEAHALVGEPARTYDHVIAMQLRMISRRARDGALTSLGVALPTPRSRSCARPTAGRARSWSSRCRCWTRSRPRSSVRSRTASARPSR